MLNIDTVEFGIVVIVVSLEIEEIGTNRLGVHSKNSGIVKRLVRRGPIGTVLTVEFTIIDEETVADVKLLLTEGDID